MYVRLKTDICAALPWQFPKVTLPAGTVLEAEPADNLPEGSGVWLEHEIIPHEYGVLARLGEYEELSEFEARVEHYCSGMEVYIGCRGHECDHADGDELHQCESYFSWHNCDSCGSSLGGDRHPAIGRLKHGELIDLEICTDCLFYHAYGDIPEECAA